MRRAAALAGLLASVWCTPALACGGLFCQNTPVDQAGEKILFAADGQTVTAHVQIQYTGAAKDFSWVVPVPTKPTLGVGTNGLFTSLRNATRPSFRLNTTYADGCNPPPMAEDAAGVVSAPTSTSVTVVSQDQVGPYDSAILTADDPGALKAWLKDNHYTLPPKLDPLLDPYVAGKYFFVALKLTKDKDVGDIQPIVMNYASTKPGIPIRLTGVAAKPDMDVFVWVLGKQRAIPENYRHAIINETRIDWLSGGYNYRDVVTEAMNDAGGQAFVTDYAGESKVVSPDTFSESHFDLVGLAEKTEPVAFAEAVVAQGFFGERFTGLDSTALVAFLKRYIPKPDSLAEVDELQFYRNIQSYKEQLQAAQVTVDTQKAVAELREKVVKPYGEIGKLLQASPYLTAMYTTMSPEEMTQDPMFVFANGLGTVSNVHEAKGVQHCSSKQPYDGTLEITLANGVKFVPDASKAAVPAALRIEQLKSAGGASVIQDNTAKIKSAAAASVVASPASSTKPASTTQQGFGCAGCSNNTAPPLKQNADEGLTYALVFLGFLGYRRYRRK